MKRQEGEENFQEYYIRILVKADDYVYNEAYYAAGTYHYSINLRPTAGINVNSNVADFVAVLQKKGEEDLEIPHDFLIDSEGQKFVQFEKIPIDEYNLILSSPQYKTVRFNGLDLQKHETRRLDPVFIRPGSDVVLNGYVNAEGNPMKNNYLCFKKDGKIETIVKTDSEGNFYQVFEESGTYNLMCSNRGNGHYYETDQEIEIGNGTNELTINITHWNSMEF